MQYFLSAVVGAKAKILGRFVLVLLTCYAASTGVASAQQILSADNEAELIEALGQAEQTQDDTIIALGDSIIELTKTLKIAAQRGFSTTLSGGTIQRAEANENSFRLLEITAASSGSGQNDFTLTNITFKNALYDTSELGTTAIGGAAVFSTGVTMNITNSTFENNLVRGSGNVAGGAVLVSNGRLVIDESTFEGNHALTTGTNTEASGGAVATLQSSRFTVNESTFNNNTAGRGGAIALLNQSNTTEIWRSTFSNNDAVSFGGAIWARSRVEIELSTFYRNSAETGGGGALFFSPLIAQSSTDSFLSRNTLFGNTSTGSGGDAILFEVRDAELTLANNLIIGIGGDQSNNCTELNSPNPDRGGVFTLSLNNLSDDSTCGRVDDTGVVSDVVPGVVLVNDTLALFPSGLAQLGDNGGPTLTVALDFQSQAIDLGNASFSDGRFECAAGGIDQRGIPVVNVCDIGSVEFLENAFDIDADGIRDDVDNCRTVFNPDQKDDISLGGLGDVCADTDEDGVVDAFDNCPLTGEAIVGFPTPEFFQEDLDGDELGDLCDDDKDGDGFNNDQDAFPRDAGEYIDTDIDGIGNNADRDDDNDGQLDANELLCDSDPLDADSESDDFDRDNIPDCADLDDDNDRQSDENELLCGSLPFDNGSVSPDVDGDNVPDCADLDDDNDGVFDESDNCPATANPGQEDANGNNIGDACDVQNDVQPVTVFQHVDFLGNSLNVGAGDVSIQDLIASSVGNDRISSIKIADGYEVVACEHSIFSGRCEVFTDSVSDLRSIGFNDRISSFRVRQPSTSPVTVFRDANFGGDSLSSGAGDVSFGDLLESSVGNDQISSIEIADGFEVLACQDSGFRGRCEVFTYTVLNLGSVGFNNQISSFRVRVAPPFPVTVFRDTNFAGNSLSVEAGEVSFGELSASRVGNDQISSIEIADGFEVVACQDGGFGGQCEIFTDSVSDLRDISFNDFISSFLVRESSTSPVTVYRNIGFRGNSLSVGEGDVTIEDLIASSVGNDRISSIQIADGYEVFACKNFRFRGTCETFTGSVSDLRGMNFNNVISSLRVQQQ